MAELMLGMPGPWANDFREEADHYTTKIGGLPDWPVPDLDVDPELLNCGLCGERLCLVAQVYAPITTPKHKLEERVIYILGCRAPKCGINTHSWRAIRVQKFQDKEKLNAANEKSVKNGDSNPVSNSRNWWDDDDDNESDEDFDLDNLGRNLAGASSHASQPINENISEHSKETEKVSELKPRNNIADANVPVLPCFYVYFQKAQSPNEVNATCENYSMMSIKSNDSASSDREDEKWEGETYEYDKALCADRTYLKFKKQMDRHPEQCLRYSYGGNPLSATKDLVAPDACSQCGSSRHFEMQLMSPLLYFLHQASDESSSYHVPDEWSWMTLIVYTCSNSCFPVRCKEISSSSCWTVAEEFLIIQSD